jgi:hypothetical protein
MFRIVLILLGSLAYGAEGCAVEVKVLIAPSDQTRAVQTLGFENKQQGRVYFYDTADLDLLKQGLILRVRQGDEDNDLTVKVRPPSDSSVITDPSHGQEDFKCESDMNGGIAKPSYSIKSRFTEKVPDDGKDFAARLSTGQRELIRLAGLEVEWKRVRKIADIQSVAWQRKKRDGLPKLSLERWEWPQDRAALELSAKVDAEDGPSAEKRLKELALQKDLLVGCDSKPKTRMVLESLTKPQ